MKNDHKMGGLGRLSRSAEVAVRLSWKRTQAPVEAIRLEPFREVNVVRYSDCKA